MLCLLLGLLATAATTLFCLLALTTEAAGPKVGWGKASTPSEKMTMTNLAFGAPGRGHVAHFWTLEVGERIEPREWKRVLDWRTSRGPSFDASEGTGYYYSIGVDGRGWPFIAVASAEVSVQQLDYGDTQPGTAYSGSWKSPPLPRVLKQMTVAGGRNSPPVYLPTDIVWRGMFANIACFAIFFALVAPVRLALRRAIRRRRGQCAACGYDLRGLSAEASRCPECGAACDSTRQATTSRGERPR